MNSSIPTSDLHASAPPFFPSNYAEEKKVILINPAYAQIARAVLIRDESSPKVSAPSPNPVFFPSNSDYLKH